MIGEDKYRFPVGNGSRLLKKFGDSSLFLEGELLQEMLRIISFKTKKQKEAAMPVYDYQCVQCGFNFEKLVFHGDKPIRCPKCMGRVKKLMSPFSIEIPDELCKALPKGEGRELCTECRQGGGMCPAATR